MQSSCCIQIGKGSDDSMLRVRSGSDRCDGYEKEQKWPDGTEVNDEWAADRRRGSA